jgi:hypothetical protein
MTAPEHEHEAPVRSEEDAIASGRIIAVGVSALVIFLVASLITSFALARRAGRYGQLPPEIGQSKIGLVEQQPFELADRGQRERAAGLEHLRGYGWSDRDAGLAFIPVERAIDLVVKGARPPPGPPPPPLTSRSQLPVAPIPYSPVPFLPAPGGQL